MNIAAFSHTAHQGGELEAEGHNICSGDSSEDNHPHHLSH
jgi:hypothetical protein